MQTFARQPAQSTSGPSLVGPASAPVASAGVSSVSTSRLYARALLVLAMTAAFVLGGRDITNEGAVSMHGDMPRHAMNGVFLYDMLTSPATWGSADLMEEAQRYFARYPALSLGHHPPLLPVLLVPFYAVFGVSILSARLAILLCFVVAIVALFALARRLYGPIVAGWASLLLATNPFMVLYAQQVMSEMLMVALTLVALATLLRFADTGRPKDFLLFVFTAAMSLGARQLAIFMFPVYGLVLLIKVPRSRLLQLPIVIVLAVGAALTAVAVAMTLVWAPFNVEALQWLIDEALAQMSLTFIWSVLSPVWEAQVTLGLGLALLAAVITAMGRDRRIVLGLTWVAAIWTCTVLMASIEPARYSIAAVPAYVLLAGSLGGVPQRSRATRYAVACLLMAGVGTQVWAAQAVRPTGAEGYESAAKYVIAHGSPGTVLFSGSVDTGYFVFFVRKNDPDHRMVVLRSDKLLTTSLMGDLSFENRIDTPQDIYPLLHTYGTRFVVVEDRPSGSRVLDWLRDELRGDRFAERLRIPIVTADARLHGTALIVYEFMDASPPAPDATIDMRIPLAGREFLIPLSDLIPMR